MHRRPSQVRLTNRCCAVIDGLKTKFGAGNLAPTTPAVASPALTFHSPDAESHNPAFTRRGYSIPLTPLKIVNDLVPFTGHPTSRARLFSGVIQFRRLKLTLGDENGYPIL